ncbi:SMR family transporter [Nonomuraea sp. NPDC026600]|uniref:DMT family transporter n=1 Tax=Nonomuraea sp. NPDC026600 TaxID=3155363 RepID=UPI0033EF9C1E
MNKWLLLTAAILLEVTATLSLRAAVDHPGWYALVAAGYLSSFAVLSHVLRLGIGIGIGVVYGIWAASGVALTAILATVIFGDPLTGVMALGIGLIIGGVLCVEIGSQAAHAKQSAHTQEGHA